MTEFCAAPQIPHADDFCNRELFGIAHLLPHQPQTECLPYNPDLEYPTGVSAECDLCGRWMSLPDKIARRRDHLNGFTCAHAKRKCLGRNDLREAWHQDARGEWIREPLSAPPQSAEDAEDAQGKPEEGQGRTRKDEEGEGTDGDASDAGAAAGPSSYAQKLPAPPAGCAAAYASSAAASIDAVAPPPASTGGPMMNAIIEEDDPAHIAARAGIDDDFAVDVLHAFGDLLYRPASVVSRMHPMGAPPDAGDGVVALPTLVHRGPGGNDALATERSVLFFTIVPLFDDDDFEETLGNYDPDAQIHAGWLIWRTGSLLGDPKIECVMDEYSRLGFELRSFGKGEKISYKTDNDEALAVKGKEGKKQKLRRAKADAKADEAFLRAEAAAMRAEAKAAARKEAVRIKEEGTAAKAAAKAAKAGAREEALRLRAVVPSPTLDAQIIVKSEAPVSGPPATAASSTPSFFPESQQPTHMPPTLPSATLQGGLLSHLPMPSLEGFSEWTHGLQAAFAAGLMPAGRSRDERDPRPPPLGLGDATSSR